jgi:branched-chain amino acid transport system substrate-binding protein
MSDKGNSSETPKKMSRRAAIRTAIGAVAVVVIGGVAYYVLSNGQKVPVSNSTSSAEAVSTVSMSSSSAAAGSIPVGVILPLTGAGYFSGATLIQGIKIAADMVNSSGGVLGRQLNLIIGDTETNPSVAKEVVTQMIEQDHIVGLVGEAFSFVARAYHDLVHAAGIPFMQESTSSDSLRTPQYNNDFFLSSPSCTQALPGINMTLALFKMGKIKNVQVLQTTDEYAANNWTKIKAAFDQAGIPYKVDNVDINIQDFTSLLVGYKAASPRADMLFSNVNLAAQLLLGKQAFESGYAPSKETPYALEECVTTAYTTDFWSTTGPGYQYWTLSDASLPLAITPLSPLGQQVANTYNTLYSSAISSNTLYGFDGMWAFAQAIKAAGSTDPAAIIQALRNLNIQGSIWNLTFPENVSNACLWHTPNIPVGTTQYQVVNQSWDKSPAVFPAEVATAPLLAPNPAYVVDFRTATTTSTST